MDDAPHPHSALMPDAPNNKAASMIHTTMALQLGDQNMDALSTGMDTSSEEEDDREEHEFTLLVPNEYVGCVLGKGGQTIRRLQWQTHTTIRVSSSDEYYPGTKNDRMITIVSTSPAAMDAAQSLVLLTIAQSHNKLREVKAIIPEESAGRIIGKGGENIQELRRFCRKCDLSSRTDDESDRILFVEGDVAQLTRTLKHVVEHVMAGGRI